MPPVLVGIARASGYRWAATKVAAIYFVLWLAALWLRNNSRVQQGGVRL